MLFSVIFLLLMLIFDTDTGKFFCCYFCSYWNVRIDSYDWNLLKGSKVERGLLFWDKDKTDVFLSNKLADDAVEI